MELLRFVAAPVATIVPDLAGTLPGRGIWVTATAAAVAEAVARNAFNRSLKRPVQPPKDLAELVDRQLTLRLRQALSLATKAGLVSTGFTKAEAAIEAGTVAALVQACDASEEGTGRLAAKFRAIRRAAGRPAPVIRLLDVNEMSLAIGRANVVHAVVADGGQCGALLTAALRLLRYRQSDLAAELELSDSISETQKGSGTDTA